MEFYDSTCLMLFPYLIFLFSLSWLIFTELFECGVHFLKYVASIFSMNIGPYVYLHFFSQLYSYILFPF